MGGYFTERDMTYMACYEGLPICRVYLSLMLKARFVAGVLIMSDLINKRGKRKSMCLLKHMDGLRDALTTYSTRRFYCELVSGACL